METNVVQERNVNIPCLEAIPYKAQALWSHEAQGQAALIWGGGTQQGAPEDTNWEGLRKLWVLTLFTSCLCLSDGSVVSAWYANQTWSLHSCHHICWHLPLLSKPSCWHLDRFLDRELILLFVCLFCFRLSLMQPTVALNSQRSLEWHQTSDLPLQMLGTDVLPHAQL